MHIKVKSGEDCIWKTDHTLPRRAKPTFQRTTHPAKNTVFTKEKLQRAPEDFPQH